MHLGALALALVLFTVRSPPGAQQARKVPTIGVLNAHAASALLPFTAVLLEALREHGYVDGQNVRIEYRFADGNVERLPHLAAELVRLNVDVILANTDASALAAKRASGAIPIVFAYVTDPVALGLVASLARPGENATGLTNIGVELTQKRLAMLKEALPWVRKVGILKAPASLSPDVMAFMKEINTAAKTLRLEVSVEEVKEPESFDRALAAMKREQVGAVLLIPTSLFYAHRGRLGELAKRKKLPLMGWLREFPEAGALLAYGVNTADVQRPAAAYLARILKGAKPADLPVEQPTKFELVINLETAKVLGLTIPPSLRLQADRVIE